MRKMCRAAPAVIVCGGIVAGLSGSLAQAQPTAGQIEKQFAVPPAPLSKPGLAIPQFDPLLPPPAAAQVTFRLQRVDLVGNTVLSTAELATAYQGLIGKDVSVAQLFGIANAITSLYGKDGYSLSRAIVPAQQIDGSGTIRIRIVEGFVDQVKVEGKAPPNPLIVAQAKKIEADRPISNRTLERYLLLSNDLPGVTAHSVLKKSDTTFGATTVVLDVEPTKPFQGTFSIDNRGSHAVGPLELDLGLSYANLLGPNSETSLRLVNASLDRELYYLTLQHKMVLNSEGTTLSFGLRASKSHPGTLTFTNIDLVTSATTGFVELRHPVIRSRNLNLQAYTSFDVRNEQTDTLGSPLSRDRLRVLRVGLDFDQTDSHGGLNTANLQLSKGIGALGASPDGDPLSSRAAGKPDFTKLTLDASRTQSLGVFDPKLAAWSLYGKATAQFTGDPLLSSEQCSLGGSDYGRAFDASTLSGDRCAGATVEVRYDVAHPGKLNSLQFYSFYDVGWAATLTPGASTQSANFASAGLGARFAFLDRYSASIEVAKQLRLTGGTPDSYPRLFVSLSGRF